MLLRRNGPRFDCHLEAIIIRTRNFPDPNGSIERTCGCEISPRTTEDLDFCSVESFSLLSLAQRELRIDDNEGSGQGRDC